MRAHSMNRSKMFFVQMALPVVSFALLSTAFAAPNISQKTRDRDGDGVVDTWTTYDAKGNASVVAIDQHKDGKPDYWKYYANGKIVKREWDRNFDGKPDLRVLEDNGHWVMTQYDNNFDGIFEKTVRAPEKGSTISVKTTNEK